MAVLLCSTSESSEEWADALRTIPGIDLRVWPDAGDIDEIDYAIVAHPPLGVLPSLPNLKAVQSLWAGIEHITRDKELDPTIPILRMIDPGLTQGMTEYVTMHAQRYHMLAHEFALSQAAGKWTPRTPPLAEERKIGILGLGVLGTDAARRLADLGFQVHGWSRQPKELDNVTCHHGEDELFDLLEQAEILICLLPRTPATEGLLDKTTLGALPEGACIINAGRGELIVDEDLIDALDSGHIAGATLDVFHEEPLSADHPYWAHPRVTVTPHIASVTRISTALPAIRDNLSRLMKGEQAKNLPGLVDRKAGY